MPKKSQKRSPKLNLGGIMNFVAWLTGLLVSLTVGFSMIGAGSGSQGALMLPSFLGGLTATIIVGWVIVIATFVGVVTAIFNK